MRTNDFIKWFIQNLIDTYLLSLPLRIKRGHVLSTRPCASFIFVIWFKIIEVISMIVH